MLAILVLGTSAMANAKTPTVKTAAAKEITARKHHKKTVKKAAKVKAENAQAKK